MTSQKIIRLPVDAAIVATTLIGSGIAQGEEASQHQRSEIKLGVTDLSFHRATGAVVATILERMGFKVTRSFYPHKENFERLRSGEIDMIASAWLPSSHGVYKARVEEVVATRELGLHYEPYALWGVPDYIPESEVATIIDLLKPSVKKKMTPTIQGIGAGAGITRFSIKMMNDYKLNDAGGVLYLFFATLWGDHFTVGYIWVLPNGGWEFSALWIVVIFAFAGGGKLSADRLIQRIAPQWFGWSFR